MSLYDDLGGAAAITAASNRFYPKILADPLVSPYFAGVLNELGVPDEKLAEVVPIFLGARTEVLNR